MSIKIQLKRTTIAGRVPNTTNISNTTYIEDGELALNLADGKLFTSDGSGIIEFGTGTPVYDVDGNLLTLSYAVPSSLASIQLSLIPNTGNTYDLGNTTNTWRNLYVGNSVTATNASFTNINATSLNVGANVNLSTTRINVGNSTVNAVVNSSSIVTNNGIFTTVNATSVNIGANVNLSTTTVSVGNSTVNTTITSNLVTTTQVKFAGAAGFPLLDTSGQDASYANGAEVHFPNFSGMIIVDNTGTTGQVMMAICGGGSVAVLGYSGTGTPHKTGTIYSNATITGYTWVNDSGATDTFTFAAIKTRNAG